MPVDPQVLERLEAASHALCAFRPESAGDPRDRFDALFRDWCRIVNVPGLRAHLDEALDAVRRVFAMAHEEVEHTPRERDASKDKTSAIYWRQVDTLAVGARDAWTIARVISMPKRIPIRWELDAELTRDLWFRERERRGQFFTSQVFEEWWGNERFPRFVTRVQGAVRRWTKHLSRLEAQGVGRIAKANGNAPRGLSLQQVALLLNDGDKTNVPATVKRWRNMKNPRLPKPIGKHPRHGQRNLYKPAALCIFLEALNEGLPGGKAKFLKVLEDIEVAPRRSR